MSLLSDVNFPLGLVLSWEEAVGPVAEDDPGWAEFVEKSRGLSEPVGVGGALGCRVAYDESFGFLDCFLSFCWLWGSRPYLEQLGWTATRSVP